MQNVNINMINRVSCLAAGLVMLGAGCSATNEIDYGKVGLVSVSGNVSLDGQPLTSAVITFADPATGNFSFARTDSSGGYTLQFDSEVDGVIPGNKVVEVSTTRKILGLAGEEGEEEGERSTEGQPASSSSRKEAVPACYNKETKLKVEVTESATINFDLKSDCSVTGSL